MNMKHFNNHGVEPLLKVSGLTNYYDGSLLLRELSFVLEGGEILCLLGPSGSGKTTLLKIIAGLENAAAGTLLYKGQDLRPVPPHKRSIGMMFQEYALFPHKNVRENVAFGLEMANMAPAQVDERVDAMLTMVGLDGFGSRRIDQLSGGERQRVALARSLAPEPELLLLDEPLGSLDRALRDRLIMEIRTILKSLGVSAIFVTHDQAEAFSVADKVAVLQSGVLSQLGPPEQLYRNPATHGVASFLGFTNFVEGSVAAGVFTAEIPGHPPIEVSSDCPEGEKILLIRPDGAQLASETDRTEPCISGTILDRRFQGATYKVKIACADREFIFDLPIDPAPPEVGDPVSLRLNRAALHVMARNGYSV